MDSPTPAPVCRARGAPLPVRDEEGSRDDRSGPPRCLVCLLRVGLGGSEVSTGDGGNHDDRDRPTQAADHVVHPAHTPPESRDAAATPTAAIPTLRFAHYELTVEGTTGGGASPVELGRGAMGVTYLARDTVLDYPVALKVIDARVCAAHPEARARFLREAKAAASLRHPNVASVFHFGEQDGQPFYAMELVEGETLEARVRRDGPLSVNAALEITRQVTFALVAAEARGIVHRDLKPANLMIVGSVSGGAAVDGGGAGAGADDGLLVKVIDFGLAKAAVAAAGGDEADLTRHGGFVGTPAFASPEQFAAVVTGEADGGERLDTRSDIYSLGVTLWYLLTGKVPFVGRSLDEIHDRQVRRRLPLRHLEGARVPGPVVTLLRGMLAADPAKRPQSARELAGQLRRCRERLVGGERSGVPVAAAAEGAGGNETARRGQRFPLVTGVTVLLMTAVAVALGLGWGGAWPPRAVAPGPPPLAASVAVPPAASTVAAAEIPEKSVAVLPFENLSADPANAFFADGVQEEILTDLARVAELKVISRTSVMQYRDAAKRSNLREIAAALRVSHVVEGSVQRSGNQVRVRAQLSDMRYDRPLEADFPWLARPSALVVWSTAKLIHQRGLGSGGLPTIVEY